MKRRQRAWLRLALIASAAAVQALGAGAARADGGVGAACAKDVDCKGDLICQAGHCASPSPGTQTSAAPPPAPAPVPAPAPAPAAAADTTKARCTQANTSAQELRRDGKLAAAREQLQSCVATSCPAIIRDDCTRRLDELEQSQPTVIFEVKDATGADVLGVSVTMDGKPWASSLEGKAVAVDPGKHVFVFEASGHPALTQTLAISESVKGRRERIVLEGGATPAPPAAPTVAAAPAPPAAAPAAPAPPTVSAPATGPGAGGGSAPSQAGGGMGTAKILGLVAGGVGVAGIGLGALYAVMSNSAWNDAKAACGGNVNQCSNVPAAQSHHDDANGEATIATVGFVAGAALLGTGVVLFLAGAPAEGKATTAWIVAPTLAPGLAGMGVKGAF